MSIGGYMLRRFYMWFWVLFLFLLSFRSKADFFVDYRHVWPEGIESSPLDSYSLTNIYTFVGLLEAQYFQKNGKKYRKISREDLLSLNMIYSKELLARNSFLSHPLQEIFNYSSIFNQDRSFSDHLLKIVRRKGLRFEDEPSLIQQEESFTSSWKEAIAKYQQMWVYLKDQDANAPLGKSWFYYNSLRKNLKKLYNRDGVSYFIKEEKEHSYKKERKVLKSLSRSLKHKKISFLNCDYHYKLQIILKYLSCQPLSALVRRPKEGTSELYKLYEHTSWGKQNMMIIGHDPWEQKLMVRAQGTNNVYLQTLNIVNQVESIDFIYKNRAKIKNCSKEDNDMGIVVR